MKKMVVILLVLVMVFVMVGGVVAADGHSGPRHGGLGYWMNYEFDDEWESVCGVFSESEFPVSFILRRPPRGNPMFILVRHHLVSFLNLTEVYKIGDVYGIENEDVAYELFFGTEYYCDIIPADVLDALRKGARMMWQQEDHTRSCLLEVKDILEAWNEGH